MSLSSVQHRKALSNVTSNIMRWSTGDFEFSWLVHSRICCLKCDCLNLELHTPRIPSIPSRIKKLRSTNDRWRCHRKVFQASEPCCLAAIRQLRNVQDSTNDSLIAEEHEVSYSTTEAPTMEPLVAESVILSASGEPVRPERKAQTPTSPRPHASDDEGMLSFFPALLSTIHVYFYPPRVVIMMMVSGNSFMIFRHFLYFCCWSFWCIFSSSFQFSWHFCFSIYFLCLSSVLVFFLGQFSLSSKSSSSSGGCETRAAGRSRTTSASPVRRLVFVVSSSVCLYDGCSPIYLSIFFF